MEPKTGARETPFTDYLHSLEEVINEYRAHHLSLEAEAIYCKLIDAKRQFENIFMGEIREEQEQYEQYPGFDDLGSKQVRDFLLNYFGAEYTAQNLILDDEEGLELVQEAYEYAPSGTTDKRKRVYKSHVKRFEQILERLNDPDEPQHDYGS